MLLHLTPDRRNCLILLAAALILAFAGLDNVPLRDFDEGYYATVAQDTYLRGDWRFPTYLGEPFMLKPPLIVWLLLGSYHLGGINELTTRWPLAAIAALSVPLLYLIGRNLFGHSNAAWISAAVLLTLLPAARLGRLAMLDGMINTFWLLTLWGLLKGRQTPGWLLLIGGGVGAIALCKGVIILPLGGLLLGLMLWLGQKRLFCRWQLWLGLLVGFTPVVAWYGLQGYHYGPDFWTVHFRTQSLDRLATAVEGNSGSIGFYALEIGKYTAPWLFFFIPALGHTAQQWRQDWAKTAIMLGGGYGVIVSLMGTKLPWYCFPCYPFMALMIGHYIATLQQQQRYPRLLAGLLALTALVGLGGGLYWGRLESVPELYGVALSLGLGLGWSAWQYGRRSPRFIWGMVGGLYGGLLCLFVSPLWNWEVNEAFAVPVVGALVKTHTPVDSVIYTSFAYSRPSLDFYGDRRVLAVDDGQLRQQAAIGHFLLLDSAAQERLDLHALQWRGQAGAFTLFWHPPYSSL